MSLRRLILLRGTRHKSSSTCRLQQLQCRVKPGDRPERNLKYNLAEHRPNTEGLHGFIITARRRGSTGGYRDTRPALRFERMWVKVGAVRGADQLPSRSNRVPHHRASALTPRPVTFPSLSGDAV
ncbi:hypothetical protein AOLI_G00221680 [Acnodon oligacanthus]